MFKSTETGKTSSLQTAQRASLDNPELSIEFIRSILTARNRQEVEPFAPKEE
jgi:hypothetical protein